MAFVGCVMCARWVSGVETRSTGSAPHTLSQPRQLEHIPLPRQEGQLEPLRCQVRPWDLAWHLGHRASCIWKESRVQIALGCWEPGPSLILVRRHTHTSQRLPGPSGVGGSPQTA